MNYAEGVEMLLEQVLLWKKDRLSFYAEDIINMMIDYDLISIEKVISKKEELNKSTEIVKSAKLPTNYRV